MSGTISGTLQTEITLNTLSPYASPLTITGSVDASAGGAAIDALQQWIITNDGGIIAGAGDGLMLNAGGTLHNAGLINGAQYGVFGTGRGSANLVMTNTGTIEGGTNGVLITQANDQLDNQSSGLITGGTLGIRFTGFSPTINTLSNEGTIQSTSGTGIALSEGAGINAAGAAIESGGIAVDLGVLSSFVNYGTISGQTGVFAESASATIVNGGTIEGQIGEAVSFTSSGGTLALLPGSVLDGVVNGGDTGELMLAGATLAGATLGSLAGIGTQIINFSTIDVTAGADWELSGTTTIAATAMLDNFGTLTETAADSLTVFGKLAGAGLIDVQNSTLALYGSVAAGQTILLDGSQSTLVLTEPGQFNGTIAGFGGSDIIEIGGVGSGGIVTETLNGNVMTLSGAIAPTLLTFATAPGAPLLVPVLGPGGKSYEIIAPCFAVGTRILTPEGQKPVEALRAGDHVITMSGVPQPIIWHGRRRIDCRRHANPEAVWPVRIKADSFGPGLPSRELYVSPDHALYVAGVLIPAKHLINGVSIRQIPVNSVIYHHIELAAHDVVWSEGLPSETYLDCGNRNQFQGGKAISLHPDFANSQNCHHWDGKRSFAPLVTSGKTLAAVRADMHEGLLRRGYQTQFLEDLVVKADGKTLAPSQQEGRRYSFTIPKGAAALCICSTAGVPAETNPHSEDRRKLGIALMHVIIDHQGASAGDPRFGAGFHAPEYQEKTWFRWTDGAARLAVGGVRMAEFTVKGRQPVWRQTPGFGTASAAGLAP
jgi:hypothetical protein